MPYQDAHLSDLDLLPAADGELSPQREAQVRAHLAACWKCRARMSEIESTITDFVRSQQRYLDIKLPSPDGSRALLKARLAELASESRPKPWRRTAWVVAAMVLVALGAIAARQSWPVFAQLGAVPKKSLTPGAIRRVTVQDVCRTQPEETVRVIEASLRRRVFEEYGMTRADPNAYEVDYLITPELGGSEDIRNLWPEPYSAPVWNAHVKDALESRLHQMVCRGELDLATAQHDISNNWISAYKKYFHTDRPE